MENQTNNRDLANLKSVKFSLNTSLLTINCISENIDRIMLMFPSLSEGFYDMFFESLKDNKITDEELTSAVKFVRDTYAYPSPPRVADFINYILRQRPKPEEKIEDLQEVAHPEVEERNREFLEKLMRDPIEPIDYKKEYPEY